MTPANLVRVQEKGQVTLPAAARRRLGIKKGDIVAVTETADGLLITPQAVIAANDIEEMRRILEEEGFSFDELIESGREIRSELLREVYGIDSNPGD
ncbi:MAG: AbrB/MazE/SpoVT family DNA-binding domain-containing protein [Thermomicrobiales bacterium]|nr:MAG: AbrB/MazE/SpoVT family DNA-binding domain-containing protein [Thermomicrobiales bacterium]